MAFNKVNLGSGENTPGSDSSYEAHTKHNANWDATQTALDSIVNSVSTLASNTLPLTGGTVSNLKSNTNPTDSTHVLRKVDLDDVTTTFPTLVGISTRTIPSSITAFYTKGYNNIFDTGESGPWVRVSSEPAHPGKVKDANNVWFELQTRVIEPGAFGVFDSTADQTSGITKMRDYWLARLTGNWGDQWGRQPVIQFPAGQFKAPGVTFSSDKTNVVIRGRGASTLLDGIQIECLGNRHHYSDFTMIDSAGGIAAQRYGIKIGGVGRDSRSMMVSNVRIRDRYAALYFFRGAQTVINSVHLERNYVGIYAAQIDGTTSGDSDLHNISCGNNTITLYLRGSGEMKFVGCHLYGGLLCNMWLEGDNRIASLESYWTNITTSNLQAYVPWKPLRLVDNGKGGTRAILSENVAISNIAWFADTAGTRFVRGHTARLADACFAVTSTTGTVSSLKANGTTELLTGAPLTWANVKDGALQIAAAVMAGTATHGYTAYADGAYVYVYPPGIFDGSAQNGQALDWTLTSGVIKSRPFLIVQTSAPHNFVAMDSVEFNGSADTAWNGIEVVSWVDSPTQFAVDVGFGYNIPAFQTGLSVAKAIRCAVAMDQINASGFTTAAYNRNPLVVRDVGPGWIDLGYSASNFTSFDIPFAGNDVSGNINIQQYGIRYWSWDQSATINDEFVNCGNSNTLLTRGTFNCHFGLHRTKSHWWCDKPVNTAIETVGIEKFGISRGRASTGDIGTGQLSFPRGIARGWGYVGMIQSQLGFINNPTETGMGLLGPHYPHGLKGGQARSLNRIQLLEDRGLIRVGGVDTHFREYGVSLPAFTVSTLPDVAKAAGCTVRVTDRANRFVTSDGTNWRYNDGTILDGSAAVSLIDSPIILTDATAGKLFNVTLSGNRLLALPSGLKAGQTLTWQVKQDSVGGRTLDFDDGFFFPSGSSFTLSTAPGAVDVIEAQTDGTNVFATLKKTYVTTAPSLPPLLSIRAPLASDDFSKGYFGTEGSVSHVSVGAVGSGYTSATVSFTAAPAGGVTAAGTAIVVNGKVAAIRLTEPGSGYTTRPTITISGDGSGATAEATIGVGSLWRGPAGVYRASATRTAGAASWGLVSTSAYPATDVGTPLAAYATRRVVSGYSGPLLQVVRDSDGATLDVGTASGSDLLNEAAVEAFLGSNAGSVSIWYDQSGNGNHATQATAANRPRITPYNKIGGIRSIVFDSQTSNFDITTQKWLSLPTTVAATDRAISAWTVVRFMGAVRASPVLGFSANSGDTNYDISFGYNGQTGQSDVSLRSGASGTMGARLRASSQACVAGFTAGAGTDFYARQIFVNDMRYARTRSGTAETPVSGGYIGRNSLYGTPGAVQTGLNDMAAVILYARENTAAERDLILPSLVQLFSITPQRRDVIVDDGDSITQGIVGTNDIPIRWNRTRPMLVRDALGDNNADWYNTAIQGYTAVQRRDLFAEQVAGLYRPNHINVYNLYVGINDLNGGTTGEAAYATVTQLLNFAKQIGFRTSVAVILPKSGMNADLTSRWQTFVSLVRANSANADRIIDYAADPVMGQLVATYNPTYWGDSTHPNLAGWAKMVPYEYTAIRRQLS